MASLQQESTGVFHVVFRFHGRRFKRSLDTKTKSIAATRQQEIEETIDLLKRDRIAVPEEALPEDFILAGGQVSRMRRREAKSNSAATESLSLSSLFEQFFARGNCRWLLRY